MAIGAVACYILSLTCGGRVMGYNKSVMGMHMHDLCHVWPVVSGTLILHKVSDMIWCYWYVSMIGGGGGGVLRPHGE